MTRPPFCPNSACTHYLNPPPGRSWFVKNGFYTSKLLGPIQRFLCRNCGREFSSQTFSLDYCAKRKLSYQLIFSHLITSSGVRDTARTLGVSPTTITNRISRLSRQAIAIHTALLSTFTLGEDLAADGFESFVCSQYFPNNINLLAGAESQFWIAADYAHIGRKGRMTVKQKKKNDELKAKLKNNRTSIYQSFKELVRIGIALHSRSGRRTSRLITDEHIQYRRVYGELSAQQKAGFVHHRISSELPRTLRNELFSVNYLDREIRKDCAEHTRETVQYARNAGNSMERLAVYRLHHNYRKDFRIANAEYRDVSHAERAGIDASLIRKELKTVFTRRRFLHRIPGISSSELKVWLRQITTPLKEKADYLPAYALD